MFSMIEFSSGELGNRSCLLSGKEGRKVRAPQSTVAGNTRPSQGEE